MAHPFAVLDTSVIILLCTEKVDDSPKELDAQRRREAAREWIDHITPRVRFAVPTPAIAELSRPKKASVFLEELSRALGRFRVLPLSRVAAVVAAKMAAERFARRASIGQGERGAVKFDTLIAAVAHDHGAQYIVTDDRRDYGTPLKAVGSAVQILVASTPRPGQQLKLVEGPAKKK